MHTSVPHAMTRIRRDVERALASADWGRGPVLDVHAQEPLDPGPVSAHICCQDGVVEALVSPTIVWAGDAGVLTYALDGTRAVRWAWTEAGERAGAAAERGLGRVDTLVAAVRAASRLRLAHIPSLEATGVLVRHWPNWPHTH